MKICPSCSTQNNNKAKFCSNCGATFTREKITKPKRKKLSKGIKSLIGIGAFIAFLAALYLSLFLYTKFYINEKFAFVVGADNSVRVVDKNTIKEPSFGGLITCQSFDDKNLSPVDIKKEFEFGAREIYAAISVSGLANGGNFRFIWKYADSKQAIFEDSYDYSATGNYFEGYRYSLIELPEGKDIKDYKLFSEPGSYTVEFYYNNKLIGSTDFTIKKPETKFTNLVVGNLINASSLEPVDVTDNYSSRTEELYSAIKIAGSFSESDNFRFTLKKSDSDDILKEYSGSYSSLSKNKYFDQYIYFYLIGPYSDKEIALSPGQYTVEFYNNSELVSQTPFTINAPEITFGDLTTSKSYNEDLSPVDETDEFILGNKMICASIKVEGAGTDDKWKFAWYKGNKEELIKKFEDFYYTDEGEDYFSGYEAINLYVPESYTIEGIAIFGSAGDYLVEFYHNDKLIDSKSFKVVDTGIKFGELKICEKVDSADKPINPKNEFNYGIKKLCATIEVKGAELSDDCKFVWKRVEDNKVLKEVDFKYSDNWTKSGDKYNGYFALGLGLAENQKLEDNDIFGNPGSYIVEFYHNGYLISSASFEIKK
jgi:hypothetical protein